MWDWDRAGSTYGPVRESGTAKSRPLNPTRTDMNRHQPTRSVGKNLVARGGIDQGLGWLTLFQS